MSESSQLDKTFQIILKCMIETGQAPHYTDIASELDVPVEEGRKSLHELFSAGLPAWLFPNTDYICSFPPFSNLPTQYASPLTTNRSGLANEGSNRWRSAGFSQANRYR